MSIKAMPLMPELEFVFELHVDVAPAMELGNTAHGVRRVIPITSGTVSGPRLKGKILNCGADWQAVRQDGVAELDARYLIESEEGVLIEVHNCGNRFGAAKVIERMAAGEPVDPSEYYFRTVPCFEVSDPRYAWLTKNIFLCSGERRKSEVILQVWMVR